MTAGGSKTVFLFPGQGSQYPGMGIDFFETGSAGVKELFALASGAAGRDMAALLRDSDAETLKRSDIAQPAITLVNLAAAAFLRERGIYPAAAAGHSLGEYAALAAAGVIGAADAFRLVTARGKAMQDAADSLPHNSGGAVSGNAAGMAAVLGLPPETVEALLARWKDGGLEGLYAANFNSPKQIAVSGTAAALAAAEIKFREAGARRFVRLQVAGPFHSPLMADAAAAFAPALESVIFADPVIPFFSNVTGTRIVTGNEIKRLAVRQITESVRWTAIEAAVLESGINFAVEAGPGKTLQGLWKDSGTDIPCLGAGTAAETEKLLTEKLPQGAE